MRDIKIENVNQLNINNGSGSQTNNYYAGTLNDPNTQQELLDELKELVSTSNNEVKETLLEAINKVENKDEKGFKATLKKVAGFVSNTLSSVAGSALYMYMMQNHLLP